MRLGNKWDELFLLFALSVLPAFTNLKIGSLQPEDFILLVILGWSCAKLIMRGFKIQTPSALSELLRGYLVFAFLLSFFSLLSLRLEFYPLEGVSILKTPVLYSVSKLLQFSAVTCGLFWICSAMIRERLYLDSVMKLYWRTGILSSLYAISSYLALRLEGFDLLGAYFTGGHLRARGFFNEGGPFGLYVVTVLMIGVLRKHMSGRRLGTVNILALVAALILSQSKAAFFALALLGLMAAFAVGSFRKRIATALIVVFVLSLFAIWIHIGALLNAYVKSYENIESRISLLGNDTNLVVGRVAGAYIVPRMIEAHPITGIGIGNYPLMRNNPKYLGDLPSIRYVEDQPGLGLVGDASELGIPLTCLLFVLMSMPYWICKKSSRMIGVVSLTQLTAHLFGVQLTFFYPWLVTACAIAASVHKVQREDHSRSFRIAFRWRGWYPNRLVTS